MKRNCPPTPGAVGGGKPRWGPPGAFILVMGCNAELTQREQLPTGQAAPALAAKAAPGGRPLRAAISGLPRGPPPIRRAPCLPWSLDPATFQPHLRWGEVERRGVSWGPRRDRGQGPGPGRVVAGWGCLLGSVAFTGCPCWPAEPGQGGVTPTVQRSRSGPAPPHGTEGCSGGGGAGPAVPGHARGSLPQALQLRRQVAARVHAVRHAVLQQRTKAGVLADTGASEPPRATPQCPPSSGTRARRTRGAWGGSL